MTDLNRRNFIKIVGSTSLILAATGGLSSCATTSSNPYSGWSGPNESAEDYRLWALSYAILAPNPHNRQPWIVDLTKKDEVLLYIDANRLLPTTDPYSRQITIGVGAFLEILRMASVEKGYEAQTTMLWPQNDPQMYFNKPFARVVFKQNSSLQKDPLFKFVLSRTTNRNPHDLSKQIPKEIHSLLQSVSAQKLNVHFSDDKEVVKAMTDLSLRAMEKELRTRHAYKESVDLLRIGESEIAKNPDGLPLRNFMVETLNYFGLLNREDMLNPNSSTFATGLDTTLTPLRKSGAFFWIITDGNSRADQVHAGARYARCQLVLTELGLSCQPVSQALQEYVEMSELRAEAKTLMAVKENQTLQMWARVGFAEKSKKSPRWPLSSFLRKS